MYGYRNVWVWVWMDIGMNEFKYRYIVEDRYRNGWVSV